MPAFNPMDPGFLENPYPFYALGRHMSPLRIEQAGIWCVFGYDECVAILRDHERWSSFQPPPAGVEMPLPSMLGSDPPRHARLRGLVSQAFTPRMVAELEPRIRAIAAELVARFAGGGEVDVVDALAYPLPVIVIAEILGVPPEDRDAFKRWSDEVVATLGSGLGESGARTLAPETLEAMTGYFQRMIDERRRAPRNDLISGLVRAELEGSKLDAQELMQMLVLLLVAGNETTTNLIGNAILAFMERPGELARLRADRALLPGAIEEVLRYSSPVQATVRRARTDVEIGGKTVRAEERALVWLAAANRDPAVFPEADRFDIGRTPNRHIGFGMGIHFCLGAPLARLEARVALEVFLERVRGFRRVDDRLLPRVPTFIMRGVRELPIAVEAS